MGWVHFGEIDVTEQPATPQGCVILNDPQGTYLFNHLQRGGNLLTCGPPSVTLVSANVFDAVAKILSQSL